jgi:hypothetical protein
MIRIKKPVTVLRDTIISNEEMGAHTVLELDTASRILHKLKTPCNQCRKEITDKTFIAFITEKTENFMFHRDCYANSRWDDNIYQNGDPECRDCGHAYNRHYDGYENQADIHGMFFAGCKYCQCGTWTPKNDWTYPKPPEKDISDDVERNAGCLHNTNTILADPIPEDEFYSDFDEDTDEDFE